MIDRIFLVGFMGAGKTTVGTLLARRLGWSFVDIDQEIQRREGRTIREIFQTDGEAQFRRLETRILHDLPADTPQVVATGGGTITVEANLRFTQSQGLSIWLRCPLEMILQRCRDSRERPLIGGRESIAALLARREPFYRRARLHLDTAGASPEEIVDQILAAIPRP
ncbi:MAG: shikimate kinase [Acidobacteria bacterium]|nr:shikimate kinase [Acidobacteriota bacterium]